MTAAPPSAYRSGAACRECGCRNWHVGRHTAECARCAAAVPLAHPNIERIA